MTRLLDIIVGVLVLIVSAAIMLVVALLIKCDSPGPILYGSVRVGRNGRTFRVLRFRTVDISKPAHLAMNERLTRAGRFVRNYSLDDLPNVINVLKGDMALVGPRPTEPTFVDLADPVWQQVLTVRPGYISWAILELASSYNTSPWPLRLQLEQAYIAKKTLAFDLFVLGKVLQKLIASKGNIKARGMPSSLM